MNRFTQRWWPSIRQLGSQFRFHSLTIHKELGFFKASEWSMKENLGDITIRLYLAKVLSTTGTYKHTYTQQDGTPSYCAGSYPGISRVATVLLLCWRSS